MPPRSYYSLRMRFAARTSPLPEIILALLALVTVVGSLIDLAYAAA